MLSRFRQLLQLLGAAGAFPFSPGNAFFRRLLIFVNSQNIAISSTVITKSRNWMNIPVRLSASLVGSGDGRH
jgi:hypothetical protein